MYTVMVTGGIGSGKSTLVELMCEHGAITIDLDEINRSLIASNTEMIAALAERFGDEILDADGAVIPSALASVAFADEESTKDLNAISFPYITEVAVDYVLNVHCQPRCDAKVLVVEVPLLTEASEFAKLADEIIAVSAPSELRLARAVGRGMDAADVLRRMAVQPTDAQRASIADTVYDNGSTYEDFEAWVDAWWEERAAHAWTVRKAR